MEAWRTNRFQNNAEVLCHSGISTSYKIASLSGRISNSLEEMKFASEAEFEEATIPFLNNHFVHWSFQIPNYNRVIDFGGTTNNNIMIGIEYKLKDWKKAMWQAVKHRLVFDFLYILIPKRKITQEMKNEAKKTGIGILLFDGISIKIVLKPKFQAYQWHIKKNIIKRWIKIVALHDRKENMENLKKRIEQFDRR